MSAPLVNRSTGDIIPASDHNDVKSYIEDGTYRVKTAWLNIQGIGADSEAGSIIESTGRIKPVNLCNRGIGGLSFYASNGVTEIARLDESGNLLLLGGVGSL